MPNPLRKLQDKLTPASVKERRASKLGIANSEQNVDAQQNGNHTGTNGHSKSTGALANGHNSELSVGSNRKSREVRREDHRRSVDQQRKELQLQREHEEWLAKQEDSEEMRSRYGTLPLNQSQKWDKVEKTRLGNIAHDIPFDKEILFTARIHHIRRMSAHLVFILLRQQEWSIQGVLQEKKDLVSVHFVRWAEHLDDEAIVLVKGILKKPLKKEITAATIHDAELEVRELHLASKLTQKPPFTVYDADITNGELERGEPRRKDISDRQRQRNRIIDLRTVTGQSVFRVQATICSVFRSSLEERGFMEIHTPKLQGGATESGSSVFQLNYFGKPAFLAQSPQLAKQMSIAADFNRVYEIGPVFRAENSNTHRHLTEYTGLDLEMAIDEHYHEALKVLDATFKNLWAGVYKRNRREVDLIKRQFPHEDLVWLDETPIFAFSEAVKLLNDSGWEDDEGNKQDEMEDLSTRAEIRIGELIKEKYKTDYYVIDKFPASARPFYTMPDPNNDKITNSFDIFLRGQEILSGGQRIHDADILDKKMKKLHLPQEGLEEYLDGFRYGAPPHAGGGIGLERVVMLLLQLGDIRHASMYARDPQSFAAKKPPSDQLRHPEASTLHPPWEGQSSNEGHEMQPLEQLIANYGDATSTSLLEDRAKVWRDQSNGAAVGYCPQGSHAIVLGDPLCDRSQYGAVIGAFLAYLEKEHKLSPIWLNVSDDVEEILGQRFGWKTMSPVAEERVDLENRTAAQRREIQRKVNHAKKEGIVVKDYGFGAKIPEDVQDKVDKRIQDWQASRKGTQVHLTKLEKRRVFQDLAHRWFFIASDKNGNICSLIALCQLSAQFGMQIKYSLDFPGAPNGAIEASTMAAMNAMKENGIVSATFGAGATSELTPGYNLKGVRVKMLQSTYNSIVPKLGVTGKSEFRQKLGAEEDPLHVCYPKHGMGTSGTKAIMDFLQSEG